MPRKPFEGVQCRCEFHTMELGCPLQRLFSTFPNGWPGAGLLLLRFCLGIALVCLGTAGFSEKSSEPTAFVLNLIAGVGGIFLLAGLWTPPIGAMIALDEAWMALVLYSPTPANTRTHIFLAILAASTAMLGPGAWSIDARLFGRKRFVIDRTRGKRPSL